MSSSTANEVLTIVILDWYKFLKSGRPDLADLDSVQMNQRLSAGDIKWSDLAPFVTREVLAGMTGPQRQLLAAIAAGMSNRGSSCRFGFVNRKVHMVWDEHYNSHSVEWLNHIQLPEVFEGFSEWGQSAFGG
jgi:hypothetical protein